MAQEHSVFTWNPVDARWVHERGPEMATPPTPPDVHAIQTYFFDPDGKEWIATVLAPRGRELAACDLVLSAPTAAAAMAGALGTEIWFLVAAPVWPQLGTDHYPWYAKSRVISCEKFADWDALMPKVREDLIAFAKT